MDSSIYWRQGRHGGSYCGTSAEVVEAVTYAFVCSIASSQQSQSLVNTRSSCSNTALLATESFTHYHWSRLSLTHSLPWRWRWRRRLDNAGEPIAWTDAATALLCTYCPLKVGTSLYSWDFTIHKKVAVIFFIRFWQLFSNPIIFTWAFSYQHPKQSMG